MSKVKVFQIGLGSFGRHGFEKLVHMARHYEEVDVELAGVCERDASKLESAERFAEHHGIDLETFTDKDRMYSEASGEKVLVYDAGASDTHPGSIYQSLQNGFYHLTEKPGSMGRESHLKEKKLAESKDVTFAVDFIERQNPVVNKTMEIVEDENIESIKAFREGCMGVKKTLYPVERSGVVGGDLLDKMVHEIYLLDFLEKAKGDFNLELEEANTEFFVPKEFESEKLLGFEGGYTQDIENAATGMTHASLSSEDVNVEIHSSWMGISKEARKASNEIREVTGRSVINEDFFEHDGKAFMNDEARFFVIKGSRDIAGDMLNKKLYDLNTGEEIETRDFTHDQLYRVIENSILEAAGLKDREVTEKETDLYMNKLFDIHEKAIEDKEFTEELKKGKERLKQLRIEDGKILENEESETVAG